MKKFVLIGCSYFLISFLPTIGFAQVCDTQNLECGKKQFTILQNEVKQKYQQLRAKLTTNQKKNLQYSQLTWMNQRDVTCGREIDKSNAVGCHLNAVQTRNTWLDTQISMCKEQTCQTIALDR